MKKQIVRMALLGATAGTMLVVSALILPTVALSTDCAEAANAVQAPACQVQSQAREGGANGAIRTR